MLIFLDMIIYYLKIGKYAIIKEGAPAVMKSAHIHISWGCY